MGFQNIMKLDEQNLNYRHLKLKPIGYLTVTVTSNFELEMKYFKTKKCI